MPISVTIEAVEYCEPCQGNEWHAELMRQVQRVRATLPVHTELSDLMQAGSLGLIDAAKKYDPCQPSNDFSMA